MRECFVQFRCQLVQEKLIEEEAIFIDGTKVEANANKFTFVWRKAIEKYSESLIEKSNQMYDELLEKQIIPEIERENLEELSTKELAKVVEMLDEKVEECDKKIEESNDVNERKQLRRERKEPKQYRKQFLDYVVRKQKYQNDMTIFGERNSYSKTDYDATFMRMKDDYMKNGNNKKRILENCFQIKKTGKIYSKRKIYINQFFGNSKADLRFTRLSVRGKEKMKNELGFAFMAVNLRKFTAMSR